MLASITFIVGLGLGIFVGLYKDKILSWFKAEETKAETAIQNEVTNLKNKL